MARVKRGNVARKRRKKVLGLAKGFQGGLSKLFRPARQAVLRALQHMYEGRRDKKGDFRKLWIARINAGLNEYNISYSQFIGQANKKDMRINRKMLAELAISEPDTFKAIVTHVKS